MSSWNNLLAGKVAVATGASRGLGRADALALAEAGGGTLGGFGQASYSATKGALLSFTKSKALEGARDKINVNAIIPGIIETEAFGVGNPDMNERMIKRTAFKSPGKPEDIANAITFLVSDKASYITGIGLPVSGGIELFTF